MRLQAAIPIDQIEGYGTMYDDDFAGPEERAARRARRKARRQGRRQRRAKRKLSRLRRRRTKLREKAGLPRKAPQRRGGGHKAARGAGRAAASAAPGAASMMDQGWDEASLEPAPMDFTDPMDMGPMDFGPMDEGGVIDAEWSEVDSFPEDDWADELEEMEGIGAFQPLRALGKGVRNAGQRMRARGQTLRANVQARRAARRGAAGAAGGQAGWGPQVRMGRHLRIQAALGHRAAVIDLKPGLYLVAEIPEAVTRTEFGVAPLLAPLMVRAAKKAMEQPQDGQPRRQGPLAALFRRRQQGGQPLRMFRAREAQGQAHAEVQPGAPKALPGPVAAPALQPAAGSGAGRTFLLPAPNVGWADEHDVAEMLGCEACEETWR